MKKLTRQQTRKVGVFCTAFTPTSKSYNEVYPDGNQAFRYKKDKGVWDIKLMPPYNMFDE